MISPDISNLSEKPIEIPTALREAGKVLFVFILPGILFSIYLASIGNIIIAMIIFILAAYLLQSSVSSMSTRYFITSKEIIIHRWNYKKKVEKILLEDIEHVHLTTDIPYNWGSKVAGKFKYTDRVQSFKFAIGDLAVKKTGGKDDQLTVRIVTKNKELYYLPGIIKSQDFVKQLLQVLHKPIEAKTIGLLGVYS
jgi:hypothetical protein